MCSASLCNEFIARQCSAQSTATTRHTAHRCASSATPVGAVHDRDQLRVAPEIAALSSAWRSPTGAYCTCITKVAPPSPSPVGAVHDRDQLRVAPEIAALSSASRSPTAAYYTCTTKVASPSPSPVRAFPDRHPPRVVPAAAVV